MEFSKRGDVILPGSVLEKRAKKKQNRRRPSKKSKSKKSKGSKENKAKKVKVNKVVKSGSGNLQSSSTNGIQRSLVKIAASIPKICESPDAEFDTSKALLLHLLSLVQSQTSPGILEPT